MEWVQTRRREMESEALQSIKTALYAEHDQKKPAVDFGLAKRNRDRTARRHPAHQERFRSASLRPRHESEVLSLGYDEGLDAPATNLKCARVDEMTDANRGAREYLVMNLDANADTLNIKTCKKHMSTEAQIESLQLLTDADMDIACAGHQ